MIVDDVSADPRYLPKAANGTTTQEEKLPPIGDDHERASKQDISRRRACGTQAD